MKGAERLLVLTYHALDGRRSAISIEPDLFRRQMETLASRGLAGISLRDAFGHHERAGRFPENAVALTFDDGFLSVLEVALPIMQSVGFRGTAFIITDLVGLNADQARSLNPYIDRDLMGWEQLAELAAGGVEIGSHSLSHPDLTRLDEKTLERELHESRDRLEQELQMPVESFAYPFGSVNPGVCAAASRAYRRACTTRLGRHAAGVDLWQVHRVDCYYLRRPAMFDRLIAGQLDTYLRWRQRGRDLKRLLRQPFP